MQRNDEKKWKNNEQEKLSLSVKVEQVTKL